MNRQVDAHVAAQDAEMLAAEHSGGLLLGDDVAWDAISGGTQNPMEKR